MPAREQQPICRRRSGLGRRHFVQDTSVKRGEIWTAAGVVAYAGKPRPVVVIQHEHFETLDSVTVCGLTSDPVELPMFRVPIAPSDLNGLQFPSRIMVDKILTLPKSNLRYKIGQLDGPDIVQLNQIILTFLGLAIPQE